MIVESVFVLALSLAAEPEFKCPATHRLPGFPERAAAMIIDGEVRGNNIDFDPNDLSPEDIGRLEVKCWNPETDAIPASEGVPLIVIWTNSALEDAHSKTLGVAERLQEFEEANGRLPTSLETLGPDVDGYSDRDRRPRVDPHGAGGHRSRVLDFEGDHRGGRGRPLQDGVHPGAAQPS